MTRAAMLAGIHGLAVAILALTSQSSIAASVTLELDAPPAYAGQVGFTVAFGSDQFPTGDIVLGIEFSTYAAITVTHLGFYAPGGTLRDPHEVGLFDRTTQTLLTSTFIQPSDPLQGGFRYAAITPLTLEEGKAYVVAGHTTLGSDGFNLHSATIAGPDLQFIKERYSSSPFGFPTDSGAAPPRYGANFKYQAETITLIPDTAGKSVFVGGEVRRNNVLIGRYDWTARQLPGRGADTLGAEVVSITISLAGGSVPKTITLQGTYSPGNASGKGGVSSIANGIPSALRNGTWSWTGSRDNGTVTLDF